MDKYDQPCMSTKCIKFLEYLIEKYEIENVFEFGSGGSTVFFSKKITLDGCLYSIEDDEFFYNRLKTNLRKNVNLNLITKEEDYPIIHDSKSDRKFWDLIFIDGKQRIECMHNAVSKSYLIAIHDAERKEYIPGFNYIESFGYRDISPEGINIKVYHHANPDRQLRLPESTS